MRVSIGSSICKLLVGVLLVTLVSMSCGEISSAGAKGGKYEPSPDWVQQLPEAYTSQQLFVVAGVEGTTAWISMHEKNKQGQWHQIMTTPGFIGKQGLGKTREGDGMTPVGTFYFNAAFGIAPDPGCAIPYQQVDENCYWSGDERPGMKYNQMVDIRQMPGLNTEASEHIVDYKTHYVYCLNISYNEKAVPGEGSAIFLHCFGPNKPYTGGCVAIPAEKMKFVMTHVRPDCVVIINSLEKLGGSL
ncbi:Choline-binding protein [Anaerovibrio sp. JC8]|uniref:L,D-transpeptidase family protein n=1 Tax=Anaerovibrio sp. JC8 TaxID=1240085 RepID=UPI000A0AD07E|nr:L,D-transpeptidase family protein [Anaerovibrio sp. JC8]ORT99646.1 Choline-binding protein [Anaerovibrio sp. JC8]